VNVCRIGLVSSGLGVERRLDGKAPSDSQPLEDLVCDEQPRGAFECCSPC
jgi:hypothetical protein